MIICQCCIHNLFPLPPSCQKAVISFKSFVSVYLSWLVRTIHSKSSNTKMETTIMHILPYTSWSMWQQYPYSSSWKILHQRRAMERYFSKPGKLVANRGKQTTTNNWLWCMSAKEINLCWLHYHRGKREFTQTLKFTGSQNFNWCNVST